MDKPTIFQLNGKENEKEAEKKNRKMNGNIIIGGKCHINENYAKHFSTASILLNI